MTYNFYVLQNLRGYKTKGVDGVNKNTLLKLTQLKSNLKSNLFFKVTTKTRQNELLQYWPIIEVGRVNVLQEIQAMDYVSHSADETTDSTHIFQLVIVIRYCTAQVILLRYSSNFFNPNGQTSNSIEENIIS